MNIISWPKILKLIIFSDRNVLILLGVLFVILNGIIFSLLGVKIMTDSSSFLNYAYQLKMNGFYIEPHYFWYIQYPIFILTAKSIYPAIETVVFFQYLLSLVALCALYYTSIRLFGCRLAGFVAGFLYIMFFEISIYNAYILSESYFVSMISISIYFVVKWVKDGFSVLNLIIGVLVLLITMSIKPTGIALLGGFGAILMAKFWQHLNHPILRLAFGMLLIIPFLILINRMLATFGFIENYKLGEIVYGISHFKDIPIYANLIITKPIEFQVPTGKLEPLLEILLFIWNHPLYWSKLFSLKLFYYLTHVRPYWSTIHNLFSLLFLMPLYFLFIQSFVRNKIVFRFKLFTVVFISINILSVCFLSVDWDGRFLLPILPILFLWVGPEIATKMKQYA